jgi:hypothetical protein
VSSRLSPSTTGEANAAPSAQGCRSGLPTNKLVKKTADFIARSQEKWSDKLDYSQASYLNPTTMTLECREVPVVYETGRMTRLVLRECRWRQAGTWGD